MEQEEEDARSREAQWMRRRRKKLLGKYSLMIRNKNDLLIVFILGGLFIMVLLF